TLLRGDPIRNRAALGFFENQQILRAYRRGNCALILGESDHVWAHCIGEAGPDMKALLNAHYHETPYYYSLEDPLIPLVSAAADTEWIFPTIRYFLEEAHKIAAPTVRVQPLAPEWIPELYAQSDYKDYTSEAYILDRLNRDISACVVYEGQLVAWGFTHDDGSLGFLHVRPQQRRKGFGSQVLRALIQMRAAAGKAVFCNIVPENTASIRMAEKLGFRAERRVSWLKLKES
ncbi:MAG: GNAT family N-acetyltransferase, partial [Candidatus Neomarinimicrobiota bacterium]